MKHWIKSTFLVVGLAFWVSGAVAQDEPEGPLVAALAVERIDIDGETQEEALVAADVASPGDLLQYTGRYTNISEEALTGLVINGPIPTNTVFEEDGLSVSQKADFEVLVEGEPWQSLPAFKMITMQDGSKMRVPATADDYRQIRWRLNEALVPEATLVTVYRVRVSE
jgi:uncharacterized repeat protein (TIGR01451 family)